MAPGTNDGGFERLFMRWRAGLPRPLRWLVSLLVFGFLGLMWWSEIVEFLRLCLAKMTSTKNHLTVAR